MPHFIGAALQRLSQERFALLTLPDANVPGADFGLTRVIFGVER
jgi:hypothetical protein